MNVRFERIESAPSAQRTRRRGMLARACALACTLATAGAAPAWSQGATFLVSRSSSGAQGDGDVQAIELARDGRHVTFITSATNVVAGDTNGFADVFVHDRVTGETTRVSVAFDGGQTNDDSETVAITPDGRFVAFGSRATNVVAGDTNGMIDVFVVDRTTGVTSRISVSPSGAEADGDSYGYWMSLSADGRYVAFESFASNLVAGDTNDTADVFVRDRVTGTTTRASLASDGTQADGGGGASSMSADGRYVLFWSRSALVPGDVNGVADAYVRDMLLGATTLVSVSSSGTLGNNDSYPAYLSADGRFATIRSYATNLVDGDTNGFSDAFLRDLVAGTTTRISVGLNGAQPNDDTDPQGLSDDGRYVALSSAATNLVEGDTNGLRDVFVRDLQSGVTTRADVSSSGEQSNGGAGYGNPTAGLSADGRFVLFISRATNLVPYDMNGQWDAFVHDRFGCSPTIATYCTAATTTHGCVPSISGTGSPSASAGSGFTIAVDALEGGKAGIIFYGISGPALSPFGGGASVLCVASPLQRTTAQSTGGTVGACDGRLEVDWNQFIVTHPIAIGVPFVGGETVWAQAWFRDAGAPGGSNLSDALWFDVCP